MYTVGEAGKVNLVPLRLVANSLRFSLTNQISGLPKAHDVEVSPEFSALLGLSSRLMVAWISKHSALGDREVASSRAHVHYPVSRN